MTTTWNTPRDGSAVHLAENVAVLCWNAFIASGRCSQSGRSQARISIMHAYAPCLAEVPPVVRPIRPPSLPVVLLALIPLVLVAGTSVVLDIETHRITRDVAAIANIHPLAGMLSSLGILLWWSSTSIWLFTAILWSSVDAREKFRFALSSACLSAYLALPSWSTYGNSGRSSPTRTIRCSRSPSFSSQLPSLWMRCWSRGFGGSGTGRSWSRMV